MSPRTKRWGADVPPQRHPIGAETGTGTRTRGTGRSEALALRGREVFFVGAGNTAGQAAIHPARHAARVAILARGDKFAACVSEYLVGEIGATPNSDLRARTGIAGRGGSGRLEWLRLEARDGRGTRDVPADAPFVLIGAEPRTGWLGGVFAAGGVRHGPVKRVASAVGEGSIAITFVH